MTNDGSTLNLQSKLDLIDRLITQGRVDLARAECLRVKDAQIPRALRAAFADVARRLQMPHLIIRLLAPIVRPQKPVHPDANPQETALYAVGLTRVGAFSEAKQLLHSVDGHQYPQVFFYRALLEISQWNYAEAILPLKRYIRCKKITEYARLVGALNLAACYAAELWVEDAQVLLAELETRTKTKKLHLLRANVLELSSQVFILQGDYEGAENLLRESARLLSGTHQSQAEFLIRKWQAVLQLLREGDGNLLRGIQQEAQSRRDWETYRDCDFFNALRFKERDLFLNLYFGTPFVGYRRRMMKLFGSSDPIPLSFSRQMGVNGKRLVCDEWALTKLERELFEILNRDFYRPFSLGEIFNFLYAGEHYNAHSSPQKVSQIILRLRRSLEQNAIPLKIEVMEGQCRLLATCPVEFEVCRKRKSQSLFSVARIRGLLIQFNGGIITATSLADRIGVSHSTACRILKRALSAKMIRKTAGGRATRYRMTKTAA